MEMEIKAHRRDYLAEKVGDELGAAKELDGIGAGDDAQVSLVGFLEEGEVARLFLVR